MNGVYIYLFSADHHESEDGKLIQTSFSFKFAFLCSQLYVGDFILFHYNPKAWKALDEISFFPSSPSVGWLDKNFIKKMVLLSWMGERKLRVFNMKSSMKPTWFTEGKKEIFPVETKKAREERKRLFYIFRNLKSIVQWTIQVNFVENFEMI